MRIFDAGIAIFVGILVVAAIVGTLESKWSGRQDGPVEKDFEVENLSEDVIQCETGIKIDFSPGVHNVNSNQSKN